MSKEVICVSESNRITGQKTFGLKHSIVIENGINLTKFNPHREFSNLRNEFGFTDEDFVIGFVGRITLQKAPLDFVKSIALARQKDKRIKALLVGQGDMEEETKEAIRLYGMENTSGPHLFAVTYRMYCTLSIFFAYPAYGRDFPLPCSKLWQ